MTARQITLADVTPLADHPGYLANQWYLPYGACPNLNAGANPGSGVIRLVPGILVAKCTINTLGVRVTTIGAAGNCQAAIYANAPSTMRPTGNALASTASMSTGTAQPVNAAVSVQLDPGLYWWASNMDNATAILSAVAVSSTVASALVGSSSQSGIVGSASLGLTGVKFTSTFGSWPDLTGQTFTDAVGGNDSPLVMFKVGSVP